MIIRSFYSTFITPKLQLTPISLPLVPIQKIRSCNFPPAQIKFISTPNSNLTDWICAFHDSIPSSTPLAILARKRATQVQRTFSHLNSWQRIFLLFNIRSCKAQLGFVCSFAWMPISFLNDTDDDFCKVFSFSASSFNDALLWEHRRSLCFCHIAASTLVLRSVECASAMISSGWHRVKLKALKSVFDIVFIDSLIALSPAVDIRRGHQTIALRVVIAPDDRWAS